MKRYTLPLAFIVIGLALFIYCSNELSRPWHGPTGVVTCEPFNSYNCDWDGYNKKPSTPEETLLAAGGATGILLVPSGIVIGIYRLVQQRRTPQKKTKSKA